MARRGTVSTEVERLLAAAREQWGEGSVVVIGSGTHFKVLPPRPAGERGQTIVLSGGGKARGAANGRAKLRRAGLRI
jgi:hypothetical protein